ncbi:MAP kinase kinase kinase (Bck1), putative [Penicillium digitatum PHI26]|uniref:Mitogen-activated protein kinase kinae kinase bck1 n=2 Tax=Penicillium digitatum TaxID=36651 RepID=K9FY60_PEND2|nr:MAP kinase kinase kinase (Bck1), putative [Penicillium digitatum Pd1]EKV05966.1 MAP kinase kinase kinase (Bck1), putative [Penicillium digitatum PHI26]EKV17734.1 MAP kinase kinase kinase (Bck1), putative [Penicillium digitatum Pd1]
MDGRQQYIPGPPPPSQTQHINLPPPPPRHPQAQTMVPPPPPGPPPGATYGTQTGWQQNWGRPALNPGFPPPPPLAPAPNQHLTYGRPPAQLSIIPPRQDHQPMTSATYIPGNDTIGVGIPGLFDPHGRAAPYDPYAHNNAERQRLGLSQMHDHINPSIPYKTDPSLPQTPSGLTVSSPYALHGNIHELTNDSPQQPATAQITELAKTTSFRHNASGPSLGGLSHSEAAIQWPLDRVLLWLAKNGFSNDWQETFKALELEGADFLELGHGSGGRGNLGKMHQVVYPQLAKEVGRSGKKWEPGRERDEGKRMRKLIRQIHDGSQDFTVSTPLNQTQPLATAFPETSTAFFSNNFPEPRSAGPVPGVNDVSSDHLSALYASNHGQKQPGQRSVTMPVPASHDSPRYNESPARESWVRSDYLRSEYTRNALSGMNSDSRRQSQSVASESGTFQGSSLRPHEESPNGGSPAIQNVLPAYTAAFSSSTGDLTLGLHDHTRGDSTESIPGSSRGTTGRYYDSRRQGQENDPRKQGLEGARPLPQDASGRQWGDQVSSSCPKEHKGFFSNILKKKTKATASSHPSPDQQHEDSSPTTSPETRPNEAYLPYIKPAYNSSDMSVGERPSTATTKTKKWVFVTMDGFNFRLVDISDLESFESLRNGICESLAVDPTNALIYLTQPGQREHEDPMSDATLAQSRRSKSDAYGSLKLFVRGTPMLHMPSNTPRVDGLGVSFTDKSNMSPTATHHQVHRKPLDEDALNRLSPHRTRPDSPLLGSRQSTLKASTGRASPAEPVQDTSQALGSDKSDLLARHEEHPREVERKQKHYLQSKIPQPHQTKNAYSDTGYRRNEIIDFDSPRISPYDEKKGDSLVPLRKPPTAPIESNTLTKVNSLSRRPTTRESRETRLQPSLGLGAAIASVGRITSAVGTPLPSVPAASPPSVNIQDSASSESDRPRSFDSTGTFSSRTTLGQYMHDTARPDRSPADFLSDSSRPASEMATECEKPPVSFANLSPGKFDSEEPPRPGLQSRKSFGPEFDFEENQVSFQRTPQQQQDSDDDTDDDSDDGLFQVRPSRIQEEQREAQTEAERKSERPSLTVNTKDQLRSKLSVRFKSPSTAGPSSSGEASDGKEPVTSTWGPVSPEDERPTPRRESFARDIWASRPAVEGVIDNLDDFFPDVDLDAPYLDEPSSPSTKAISEHDPKKEALPPLLHATHALDAAPVRPAEPINFARQKLARGGGSGGGLSRMKSIRQVAQGANRTNSVSTAGPQRSGDLLRRKSTKMFGAKIMQIKPRPGTRLSQLDPIPQNSTQVASNTGPVPQRQPTFRIIRGQLIGKGTYGRVYLGMNADNGEVLAVKLVEINPRIAGADKDRIKEMVAALDQEIDTMQHLEHPNIVQYLGCERGEFSISIYLEYISGGSVGSCLRKHGKFEESVVRSLTRQTLDGLAYLHDKGILHRDMKADNILLDLDGTCKISDFGISKKTDDIYGNDSSNSMQGSVFWMAPEVIQSQGQGYSAKVDIWSLGCVVLEMFAGRRPWSKEEAIGAIFKLGSLSQAPPIPDDVSMNISPAALAFMYDCFTIDSAERPTAGTLLTRHPFCESDANYNFLDTELYAKIRDVL